MLETLLKAFRSLKIHRLRSFLSTLGVMFGVMSVVTMLSIGEGAKQETLQQIQELGLNSLIVRSITNVESNQGRKKRGVTLEDGEQLYRGIPKLELYVPLKNVSGKLTGTLKEMAPEIIATTPSYRNLRKLKLSEGHFISDLDLIQKRHVCVLGKTIAQELGKQGHVGQSILLGNHPFIIVGVLAFAENSSAKNGVIAGKNMDKLIILPLGTEHVIQWAPREETILSEIFLRFNKSQNPLLISRLVKHILSRKHAEIEDYQIVIPKELMNQAHKTQHLFNLVLGSLAGISLLVGGIGIMNIMLATISERTREIGIRRSLGATKRHIWIQFLSETLVLSFLGALLGLIFGIIFSYLISYVVGWKTVISFWSILISLSMAIGTGFCSGIYPAMKAATVDPIIALRHI